MNPNEVSKDQIVQQNQSDFSGQPHEYHPPSVTRLDLPKIIIALIFLAVIALLIFGLGKKENLEAPTGLTEAERGAIADYLAGTKEKDLSERDREKIGEHLTNTKKSLTEVERDQISNYLSPKK